MILSGGLTPRTSPTAIAAVDPYAVDVASGVEAAPGIKDPEKLRRVPGRRRAAPVGGRARDAPSSTASAPTAASTSPRR